MSRVWVVALLLTISFRAFSQESNCSDGIDNDGDGFIDCYDSDCSTSTICKDFFIGGDKLCQAAPLSFPQFKMKAFQQSPDRTAHSLGRVSIGDLDRDGIPEVVSVHTYDKKLYILRGSNLSIKYTANTTGSPQYDDIAIGNIKNDNCGEIFIAEESGGKWYVSSYDCQAKLLWRTQVYGQPFDLGLADFDGDGKVEVYYRNEILDAETGTILVKGTGDWTTIDAGPVAVDIFDDGYCTECPGLELVLGGSIYAVDLTPRSANAGALILQASMPRTTNGNLKYWPKLNDWGYINTATSVADYNLDGYLDVLVSGAAETYKSNGSVDQTTKGPTTVYFWDVKNNRSKAFQPSNNWQRGTGRLNIADIDGNGKQNTTFVTGSRLYALDENFNQLWVNTSIVENTSGFTGTTVFDFNNDGAVETVYRDESYLYIINGKDGSTYASTPCKSRTANEYPIVADVNGDGVTEICVTCATDNNASIEPSENQRQGHVRTYTSDLEPWVPARKIWNQHGYFNVNINDDLTIPKIQQKHHLVFSTAQCETGPGSTGPNRPLNTFLNQSAYLDSKGCATYASPDINFVANSLSIQPPTCPDQNFTVSFSIRNSGDMALSGSLPITFYSGNPKVAGAVKLNTTTINLTQLGVNGTYSVSNMTVNGTGNTFTMYAVLNDAGTSVPTPIKLPNSNFVECNYDNNIASAQITPGPFPVQAALISDNFKCGAGTGIPNGAVEAYRLVGGVKETANYTFYWFNGNTVGDTTAAAFKGAVWTGLTEGTYSVVAYHKGFRCGSGSAQVTVGVRTKTLNVTLTENSPFTKCKNPDGQMTATVNNGEPVGNFTYEWFKGTVFGTSPTLSKSHVITDIDGETYSVLVTDKATGCQIIASSKVRDQTIKPVVTASATDANCNPSNSGTVSANVAGNTSNYNFYWYSGTSIKPSPDYTGSTINSLTAGNYVVVAESKSTECTSLPVMVTIGSKTSPTVTATVTHQQTSCALPNGSASASVSGAGVYAYKWYRGNSTLAADQIITSTTASITGLAAGQYTVEATNTTTGCADTELFTITDVISTPSVSSSIISHQTNCTPFNGSVSASANGSAGPFQYYWFNGNVGTPDTLAANFKGVNYSGLQAGYFTVVAVDKITRCASPRSLIEVLNNTVIPTITTSTVDQTSCDTTAPNGQISANISGATTGYTFTWYAGSGTGGTVVGNTPSVSSRAAGIYTVRAVKTSGPNTGCSNTSQVTVVDNKINPTITQTIQPNTNCVGTTPTGSITLQVNGGVDPITNYTIVWFEGNGTSTPLGTTGGTTGGVNKEIAQGLKSGNYTVRVTDNVTPNTSCATTKTFTVTDNLQTITINNADLSLTHDSNCSPDNGSARVNEVTVNGSGLGSTSGYTFTWLQSNGTTPIASAGTAATIAVPLASGNYYVRATNTTTMCSSPITPFTINDTHVNPIIAASTIVNNTNCGGFTPNGSITITVDGVAPAAGQYTIQWFEGTSTTTPLGTTVGSVTGTNNRTAQELSAGTYTIRVTDTANPNNGCVATATFTINNVLDVVTIDNADLNLTHDANCSPDNGSAAVTEITVNGVGLGSTAGYTFTWLQSNGTTPIASAGNAATIAVPLASGNYYVRATNSITNCSSAAVPFTINDTHVNPAIAASATVNNTNCNGVPPNGSITITVDGAVPVAGQHTLQWFVGSGTTTPLAAANITGSNNQTAQALAAGTYTVRVTDNATPKNGCVATATFTINNVLDVVTIDNADLNLTHDANCSPDNGSAAVTEITVNGVGLGSTAGYTFTWLQSNGTTPIASAGNAATIAVPLTSGNYFVRATNSTTNCSSPITPFTINDTHVNPTIAALPTTDNTNCAGVTPNGNITITVNGVAPATGQYTIQWFEGTGTTTPLGTTVGVMAGANNETANLIDAGTYTVRVTDTATPDNGCAATASFTINDNLTYPTPGGTTLPNTACDPTMPNGSIAVTTTVGESYLIFKGQNTLPINDVTDLPAFTADDLSAGIYTIQATITTTGCKATSEATVANAIVIPVINAAPTNVTICTPPNGSVTASLANGVGTLADYSFKWYNGNLVKASPDYSETSSTLSNIPAGFYTVTATNTVLGCEVQEPITVEVINDPSRDITITELLAPVKIPASDCNNGNGQLGASASSSVNVDGFTFEWWESDVNIGNMILKGNGTPLSTSSSQLSAIKSGPYTIIATDNTTGCIDSLRVNLPFIDQAALLSIETLDQTNCTIFDGGFEATVNPSPATLTAFPGINQTWYQIEVYQNGVTILTTPGTDPETVVTGLKSGNYTVLAREMDSNLPGCISEPSDINIVDATVKPVIVADVILDNKNCTGSSTGTGSIALEVDGTVPPTADYTYIWHDGSLVTDPTLAGNNVLSSLSGGPYTVQVTNVNNNCTSQKTFNVSNVPYVLSIPVTLVPQTDCAPDNGSATATDIFLDNVSAGSSFPSDFTFKWYESDGTTVIASSTGPVMSPLGAGDYFVSAFSTTSNCESPLKQFTIDNNSQPPVITASSIVDNANCSGASIFTGSITIDVNGAAPLSTDFTIQWFTGSDTSSPIAGETTPTLSNLAAGDYTVEVTDILTPGKTCSAIATFTITDDLPAYTIDIADITVIDQTDCSPNGDATVTDIFINGVSNGGTVGFAFEWFDDNGVLIDGPLATDNVAVPLGAGTYRVVATNTTSMCSSIITSFNVIDISTPPVITLDAPVINNANCYGATANGSITIDVNGATPISTDFVIQWFSGSDDSSPIVGATAPTLADLAAGDYTVKVTDILTPGSTCVTTATFTVIDDLPEYIIDIADITVIDQSDCAPNGDAIVTDILIDGISNSGTAGFTFEWFDNSGSSIEGPLAGNDITLALAAGNYSVMATNTATACGSTVTAFTVNDISAPPVITLDVPTINNSNCDGATANGSITIDVNGAAPLASEFTIQWFSGIDDSSPIAGATSSTLANLAAGNYTVKVTDLLSPGSTCFAITTFTVIDDLPVYTINTAAITIIDQSDCTPNGDAIVTDIFIDGASNSGTAGFTFEWFDNSGTTIEGPFAGNDITLTLAAGNYSVIATNTTSTCSTILTPFTINDISTPPTISLNVLADNTNCTTANGSITIDVDGAVPVPTDFAIQWFTGSDTSSPIAGATTQTLANLTAGDYTVQVTDILSPGSTCLAIATFSVIDDLPEYTINSAAITIMDQSDCTPNGDAIVTDILINGVTNFGTTGFTFEWFDDNGSSIEGPLAGNNITGPLAAGNYSVVATNTTSTCSTILTPFTVDNISTPPVISINALVDNTNCTTPNGSITIEVNGAAPITTDFNIQWYNGTDTSSPIGGATTQTLTNLVAGDYTVQVTDILSPGSACLASATFSVVDDLLIIGIDPMHISINDQSNCTPANGDATVNNLSVNNGTINNLIGYTFTWFESDGTTVIPGSGNTPSVGVPLSAGNYFVQATNTTSNCSSPMTPFVIDDVTMTPTIVAVQNFPNISCDTNFTGELSATVSEGTSNGITAGYQFEWFRGANNTNPVDLIGTGNIISNLQEGDYTVQVTDLATPGNGCIGTATINLKREIPILNATLSINNQTVCLPVNGGINVVSVQQTLMGTTTVFDMSNPASLANFTFQWFDENLNPVSGVINGSAASPNLLAGTYYVQVTNTLGCVTGYTRAVIEDITVHPDVVLDGFNNPSVCILPETTGNLNIIADGSINFSDYTFTWYEGSTASGTVTEANNPILSNIAYTDQLTYTVRVTNNTTNCYSDATYTFATDTVEIRAIASAVPLTSCVTPNGSLFSTVQNGAGPLYNYEWYSGTVVGTSPVFTTNEVLIAPIGMYTVVARHPSLNFCTSVPSTVEVIDGRMYPVADVTLKAPLTYCDPARPNGVAKAEVNGMVTNHIFEWYEGSATGNLIYTGSEAGSLRATTYFVKAIDVISGCDNTASILIPNAPVIVTAPQIEVLAERTDCLNPNGILTASVNGNTQDYSFLWYNGNNVKNQPDVISESYYDLYSGAYTVTAMDRVSGCISPPVSQTIKEIFSYPAFEVKSEAANCDEANGTAEVITLNDIEVTSIEWDINGAIGYGGIMGDLPAGTYIVTATSQLNCSTTEEFTVLPDITVYNGISRNNDGVNDIFEIGCINDFPNNSVKIFNRSGTLVYEAKYYDNQETFFNGVSNRGISLLGNELPSGTYFYIIDKGNGSKPRTGYLELMR